MTSWPVQDAKARFSELLDTCVREGPQMVTRRGAETAVLVPVEQWRGLTQSARPTLKELLLQRSDTVGSSRSSASRRPHGSSASRGRKATARTS